MSGCEMHCVPMHVPGSTHLPCWHSSLRCLSHSVCLPLCVWTGTELKQLQPGVQQQDQLCRRKVCSLPLTLPTLAQLLCCRSAATVADIQHALAQEQQQSRGLEDSSDADAWTAEELKQLQLGAQQRAQLFQQQKARVGHVATIS